MSRYMSNPADSVTYDDRVGSKKEGPFERFGESGFNIIEHVKHRRTGPG